jgi:hypothetical protein
MHSVRIALDENPEKILPQVGETLKTALIHSMVPCISLLLTLKVCLMLLVLS